jgi:pimeloyl-ACP methyl ester carboxylesterase
MRRHSFLHDSLRFSYLDDGGPGLPIIALHAHWFEATSFETLARALGEPYRVIALDQRGHGDSDHAKSYTRDDYVGDLEAFVSHLGLERVLFLGNSLGGVNAYYYAARHPERVKALVVEDIGVRISENTEFVRAWAGVYARRQDLVDRIGPRLAPYMEPFFRETPQGWTLPFDPNDMVESQRLVCGDHSEAWLGSDCPALVIRGSTSRLTTTEALKEMAARRPHTRFVEIEGGHATHVDNAEGVAAEVKGFLGSV